MSISDKAYEQAPALQLGDFDEVNQGFSREEAIAEAARCLQCKKPLCTSGCPVEVDIPQFIAALKDGKTEESLATIKKKNSLPAICGRVCPQEHQCEAKCILGRKGKPINIGRLERFVADQAGDAKYESAVSVTEKPKVAVVGSGPAGLTAAADLALMGYRVTVFESLHKVGGVLRYGIPEFRLPKAIVDKEVEYIQSLGVKIETNVAVGQTITLEELWLEGFEAVFVGTGAGLPYFLGIPGETLGGVYSANEFLTRVNLMKAYRFPEFDTPIRVGRSVAVFGAGNVAMDAARTALRLGAESVTVVYRRSEEEVPARAEEVENAREEGIRFEYLANPVKITAGAQGQVVGVECVRMELGEADDSGRRRPHPIPGSGFCLPVDTVIVAVGQGPNPIFTRSAQDLQLNKRGYITVDGATGATNIEGVFAGGDIVTGAATVIAAMGSGKLAAKSIDQYLQSSKAHAEVS